MTNLRIVDDFPETELPLSARLAELALHPHEFYRAEPGSWLRRLFSLPEDWPTFVGENRTAISETIGAQAAAARSLEDMQDPRSINHREYLLERIAAVTNHVVEARTFRPGLLLCDDKGVWLEMPTDDSLGPIGLLPALVVRADAHKSRRRSAYSAGRALEEIVHWFAIEPLKYGWPRTLSCNPYEDEDGEGVAFTYMVDVRGRNVDVDSYLELIGTVLGSGGIEMRWQRVPFDQFLDIMERQSAVDPHAAGVTGSGIKADGFLPKLSIRLADMKSRGFDELSSGLATDPLPPEAEGLLQGISRW